jgi:hypothetical protein
MFKMTFLLRLPKSDRLQAISFFNTPIPPSTLTDVGRATPATLAIAAIK